VTALLYRSASFGRMALSSNKCSSLVSVFVPGQIHIPITIRVIKATGLALGSGANLTARIQADNRLRANETGFRDEAARR
jgi:hypothetical protein